MGSTRRYIVIALGAAVLVLAVAQIVSLFGARIEAGDTFAPYSTLRADPLGLMAVYNALDALPEHSTLRYVRPFEELPDGPNSTLVIAGAGLSLDPPAILDALDNFIETGGRAVVTFRPMEEAYELNFLERTIRRRDRSRQIRADRINKVDVEADGTVDDTAESGESETDTGDEAAPADEEPTSDARDESTPADEEPTEDGDDSAPVDKEPMTEDEDGDEDEDDPDLDLYPMSTDALRAEDISERWGFDYGFEMPEDLSVATRGSEALPVEESIRVKSGLYFQPEDDAWTTVYSRPGGDDEEPLVTVMERQLGLGTIVLCADTYFLSNEALREDRVPATIQWAMGNSGTLIFSETHLGQGQRDRLMTLVRRYRLHGVLAGFALMGFLFIWKNSTTLIPRGERRLATLAEEERSQHVGLDNLLSRYVPPARVIDLCVEEWQQHFAKSPAAASVAGARRAGDVDGGAGEERAVAQYNRIVREIKQRKS